MGVGVQKFGNVLEIYKSMWKSGDVNVFFFEAVATWNTVFDSEK